VEARGRGTDLSGARISREGHQRKKPGLVIGHVEEVGRTEVLEGDDRVVVGPEDVVPVEHVVLRGKIGARLNEDGHPTDGDGGARAVEDPCSVGHALRQGGTGVRLELDEERAGYARRPEHSGHAVRVPVDAPNRRVLPLHGARSLGQGEPYNGLRPVAPERAEGEVGGLPGRSRR
jgi:hypothetical protein